MHQCTYNKLAFIEKNIRTNKNININTKKNIMKTKLSLQTGQILVGTIVATCLSEDNIKNYPDWLICDGSPISKDYELMKFMERTPKLCGRALIGAGMSDSETRYNSGQQGGEENHKLTENEMPAHNHHGFGERDDDWPFKNGGDGKRGHEGSKGGKDDDNYYYNTSLTGGGSAHNNMQPYHVVNYIVYAKKIDK